jgi:hypothetical protein
MSVNFKVKLLLPVFFATLNFMASAQDSYEWWNRQHNWDGQTPKLNYIKRTPGFLGPNALPVPDLNDTKINFRTFVYAGARYQFDKSERVINPEIGIYFPFQKNRIAFSFYSRLFEFFETDSVLRDKRFARDSICSGVSKSESFLSARARVWENLYFFPDFTIEFGLKLNTGKNLENARHTNAPGYWFLGNFAKDIYNKERFNVRIISMFGGFIWQAGDNQQNDSWLYGLGLQFKKKSTIVLFDASGYRGYRNNGDRPLVARFKLEQELKQFNYFIQYQRGINNFIGNGIFVGLKYKINWIDTKNPY